MKARFGPCAENGAARQPLLTAARVPGTQILLDRLTLAPGSETTLTVPAQSLAWFQLLQGEAVLGEGDARQTITEAHVVFLPPAFAVRLASVHGAALLYGEIPQAGRLDPEFAFNPPAFRVIDWTREPVLDSEHDARKRIYLVTPKLFGTKAVKGEMIIYPPGTQAANHHHEGAAHFMYVLRGRGTVYANEKPFPVRTGDVIYYPDLERHYLEAAPTRNWRSWNISRQPNSRPSGWTRARSAPGCRPGATFAAVRRRARSRRIRRPRSRARRMCDGPPAFAKASARQPSREMACRAEAPKERRLVPTEGFEPPTPRLRSGCSTAELRRLTAD